MARDPGSVWAPLPEAGAPDGYIKTQFIVHSTGDNGLARSVRDNWFARPDVVVESTFIVGWGPSRDDPTLQIMDSTDNADANGSANQRGISIEVVGDGIGPFTAWQVSELVRLGLWARKTHSILPRIIPSESAGGFGWHVMFGAPGPWTSVPGKVCPGAVRIGQLKSTVFPAIFAGTPFEEDFMATMSDQEKADLMEVVRVFLPGRAGRTPGAGWVRLDESRNGVVRIEALVRASAEQAGIPQAQIDQIVEGVADRLDDGFDVTLAPKPDPAA